MDKKAIAAKQLYDREMPIGVDVDTIMEIVPDMLIESLANKSARFSRFEVPGSRGAWEIVSRAQRQALVREAIRHVKQHFFSRGLPYAHLWYLPRPFTSIFCFRVDCDGFTEESSIKTLELARQHNITMSWYIDVSRWEKHLDFVKRLKEEGQDVQLHCYSHRQLGKKKVILEDIRKALAKLKEVGVHPNGYAAPFGTWSEELSEALEELGFSYSSEFSLAYDEYPFCPAAKGKLSKVLQVPIHPICIGTLIEAGLRPEKMLNYFLATAQSLRLARLPVIMYGHPVGRIEKHPQVLESLLNWASSVEHLWIASVSEFAEWWKMRASCAVAGTVTSDAVSIETAGSEKYLLQVERDGREAFSAPAGSCRVNELKWQEIAENPPVQLVRSPFLPRTLLRTRAMMVKIKKKLFDRGD